MVVESSAEALATMPGLSVIKGPGNVSASVRRVGISLVGIRSRLVLTN